MLKFVTILFLLIPSLLHAHDSLHARVTYVEPIYRTVVQRDVEHVCRDRQVPVHRYSQANSGDVIIGAIIGGAIGNQVGSNSKSDVNTAVGAILGATILPRRSSHVGYERIRECHNEVVERHVGDLRGYTVHYSIGNQFGSFISNQRYNVGDLIYID